MDSLIEPLFIKENEKDINFNHPGVEASAFAIWLESKSFLLNNIFEKELSNSNIEYNLKTFPLKVCSKLASIQVETLEELVQVITATAFVLLYTKDLNSTLHLTDLLNRTFLTNVNQWESHPVFIHMVCKTLYGVFDNDLNLIYFARKIWTISRMSFFISTSLIWALFFRLVKGTDVEMFTLHKFSTLIQHLKYICFEDLKNDTTKTYIILSIISFLQNVIVFCKRKDLICYRFENYFKYKYRDLQKLLNWCQQIKRIYGNAIERGGQICNTGFVQIRNLLDFDIIHLLERVINNSKQDACSTDESFL